MGIEETGVRKNGYRGAQRNLEGKLLWFHRCVCVYMSGLFGLRSSDIFSFFYLVILQYTCKSF